jgi:DNA-binding NtrC family response regulator
MVRVLLVDDDQEVLDALGDWLRREFEVELALGFPQAILALATGPTPDVVITDLEMPPYSGEDLLAVLAARYPKVCRILHTATAKRFLPMPSVAHHVLEKGGDPARLDQIIRSWTPAQKIA